MKTVNGDGLSREHLIRQVAKRLSPELRAEYYDMLRHCRSLPVNDELLVILNAIQLLSTLTIDVPAQMASEREKIEGLLKSNAKAQEHLLQAFLDQQAKFDQRLASFPQEIATLISPEVIAALVTESVRQQFDKTAIPETAKLVRSGANDVNAAVVELRSGARTIGKVMKETLLEGNGFLKRVESLCLDSTERVACAAERMATILNASIGGLMLLACGVGVAVGLMLGIFLHDWWSSPAPPVQPAMIQPHTSPVAGSPEGRQKAQGHRK